MQWVQQWLQQKLIFYYIIDMIIVDDALLYVRKELILLFDIM